MKITFYLVTILFASVFFLFIDLMARIPMPDYVGMIIFLIWCIAIPTLLLLWGLKIFMNPSKVR